MADTADSTPASGGQFALTVADLNTDVNHEPRVEDLKLGFSLGMKNPASAMRKLIERHRESLERFGKVVSTVEKTTSRGGRPGRTFWLNKRQCLYLCTKSETPRATDATIQMVEVFDAHLAGRLAKPVKVAGHARALPKPARTTRPKAVAPAMPTLERDGFAAMRLGGEMLLVDLRDLAIGAGTRAVVIGWDDTIVVQDMSQARSNAKFLGARNYILPDPTKKVGLRSVWAVGTVVATQPAAAPGDPDRPARGARTKRAKPPRAGAALPPRPDLARIEVCGTA